MRLIVLKEKGIRHGGQWYKPGDEIEIASASARRVHIALGNAAPVGEMSVNQAREQAGLPPVDERESLRARAEAMGIEVDGRWGVARLEEEIAEAQKKPKQRIASQEEPQAAAEGAVQAVEVEDAAQPTSDAVEGGDSAPAHGRYHRRDMQAED